MSIEAGSYNCPHSMEDHEIHEAFHGGFSVEMLVAGLGEPFQLISSEGSFNNSFNHFLSSCCGFVSDSDELCQFSDNVVFQLSDNCDWIDEMMIESTPFAPHSIGGDGSSFHSFQSNCSWTDHRLFEPSMEKEGHMSPSTNSSITTASKLSERSPMAFNRDLLEEGNPGLIHLIKAIGEAKQDGSLDLVDVITKRILEIVSPLGTAVERMGFHMFQSSESQYDYIRRESMKIGKVVFQAFSTLCIYNLFPILMANATILSSIPEDIETVHILDFDMQDGSQWPPFLEAIGFTKRVRLTSLRWSTDYNCDHSCSKFEETKKHLLEYAKSKGLRLVVNEMFMEELLEKKTKQKRGGSEFLVFNCVLGLPHIGQQRTLSQALNFLKVSKKILESSVNNRGIITFCNASVGGFGANSLYDFASYFDECLMHSKALFESTEWHIPSHQVETRTAIECLFLGPLVSSSTSITKWEEIKEAYNDFASGLQDQKLSTEVLTLAMEMVKGQGLYDTKLKSNNEVLLEWEGTPLVRFSAWR